MSKFNLIFFFLIKLFLAPRVFSSGILSKYSSICVFKRLSPLPALDTLAHHAYYTLYTKSYRPQNYFWKIALDTIFSADQCHIPLKNYSEHHLRKWWLLPVDSIWCLISLLGRTDLRIIFSFPCAMFSVYVPNYHKWFKKQREKNWERARLKFVKEQGKRSKQQEKTLSFASMFAPSCTFHRFRKFQEL